MPAPTLITPRLLLRHWKKEDLAVFAKMNVDPKVMQFFPSILNKRKSDDLAKKIQKELDEKKFGFWAIEVPNVAPFIGFAGLHIPEIKTDFTPCVEIGWRLDSNYWNKGYAIEAAKKVLEYGFLVLKLPEIVSFAPHIHERSRRIMEKLHMRYCHDENFYHPKYSKESPLNPFVLYRITKKEYESFKKS
jgi:RimJ/RimL family protein N-acetyltransferase